MRSSLASTAAIRSASDQSREDPGRRLGHGELLLGQREVHQARPSRAAGTNTGSDRSSSKSTNSARTAIPTSISSSVDPAQVGHDPRPLLQLDQADRQRVLERGDLGVVDHHVGVERAAARPTPRCPTRASRTRRTPAAAGGAACRTTCTAGSAAGAPAPPRTRTRCPGSAPASAAAGAPASRSGGRYLRMRKRMVATGSPASKSACTSAADPVLRRHVGVGDGHVVEPGREEAPGAEAGPLGVRDRLDDRAHQHPVAHHQGTDVVLLAVGGHHRGQALVVEQAHHDVVGPGRPARRRSRPGPPRPAARRAGPA